MALTSGEQRAISKALALGGAAAVRRVRFGSYKVGSATRPGREHTVSQDTGGRLRCSCEAGLAGRACWHVAAVFVAKVEHGGGRVTGPAAPAPAVPAHVVAGATASGRPGSGRVRPERGFLADPRRAA